MTKKHESRVICPRCDGDGCEPGVPYDEMYGRPLCNLCQGDGRIWDIAAADYEFEQSLEYLEYGGDI